MKHPIETVSPTLGQGQIPPCTLMCTSSEALMSLTQRFRPCAPHKPSAFAETTTVLTFADRDAAILNRAGVEHVQTVHAVLANRAEAFRGVRSIVLYNMIVGFPSSLDVSALLFILLALEPDARVTVLLDTNRIQGMQAWGSLIRAGFVPATIVPATIVPEPVLSSHQPTTSTPLHDIFSVHLGSETDQPFPACTLDEARQRLCVEMTATAPDVMRRVLGKPWNVSLPATMSDEAAIALTQHPNGAVRATALLQMGVAGTDSVETTPATGRRFS